MTELKKTQGFIATDPKTSSRQVQELERSTQTALKTVEGNAPCFMGYFHDDGVPIVHNEIIRIHRFNDMPSERINVNGKDPDGTALKFEKPGYYMVSISTAVRLGLGVNTGLVVGRLDGKPVCGAFARGLNGATITIPLVGSGLIRVPQGKPLSFYVEISSNNTSQPETLAFRPRTQTARPNFSVIWVRPLEGSR